MHSGRDIFLCLEFYTSEDLKDPDTPQRINLTIDDFNAVS